MPSADRDQPLLLRRFRGVNVAVDSAFLPPDVLQSAENWVPDLQGLLAKRLGTLLYGSGFAAQNAQFLGQWGAVDSATLLLLEVSNAPLAVDSLFFWKSTGGNVAPVSPTDQFTQIGAIYGAAALGGSVYIGNGIDPIKRVTLSGVLPVATDLAALAATTTTGGAAVNQAATATAFELPAGTYTYAWAVYDHTTKLWVSREATAETIAVTAGNFVRFTIPTTALSPAADRAYHLFVAPRGLPLEFAHDQFPNGLVSAGTAPSGAKVGLTIDLNVVGADGLPIPVKSSVVRTGNMLVSHRGRIWMAGDQTSAATRARVYATGPIVPGLEQALFDQGDFYPANAVLDVGSDGDPITGLAVATSTDSVQQPSAPLLIFKNTQTWLLTGDILDDDSASLIQLSGRIGCVAHRTIANTPFGVIFCGQESVYLIRPDTLAPLDIGAAIGPSIRDVPTALRTEAVAMYHKGFYKLAWGSPGDSSNFFTTIETPG